MSENNSQWVKKAAIVAGCTVVAAGATYLVYRQLSKPQKVTAETLKELGNSYFQQKNYQQAVKTFDEALKLAGNDQNLKELRAICHQNAAACLEKLDRLAEAILRCSEAVVLRPNYLKALIRRGSLHAQLGEYEECLRDFALVSMIDPQSKLLDKVFGTFEKAHQQLAETEMHEIMLHRQQGIDFPIPETSVLEWLAYSVTKDPVVEAVKNLHVVEDRYDSILSLIKHKKYDLVASAASEEVQKDDSPHKLECAYVAARFFSFHNNPKKVREWVDKFYELYGMLDNHSIHNENIKAIMIAVFNIQAQTSDTLEEAQIYVDKAKELDPTNTDVYFGYTSLAVLNREIGKAKEALEQVLAIDKNHPYVKFFLNHFEFTKACEESHMANIHNVILKMEQLLEQYEKAPIFTYTVLSNIHANSGNFPLALEILEKGLKAYPNLSEFIMLKTLTQAKCNRTLEGNVEDMTQVFIDLCKADPNNFEAQATYGKICSGKKEYDKALESLERAIMLARQPQELRLAVQELILTRAAKEANFVLEQLTQETK